MAFFRSGLLWAIMFLTIYGVWAATSTSDTIIKPCNDSLDRNFCISSLSKSPGALQADLAQLSIIAVHLCIEEVKPVYDFIVHLRERNPNVSGLTDCVELLEDTKDELHDSESKLRRLSDANFNEYVADVMTCLSAGETNQDTCVTGLQETHASQTLLSAVKAKTDYLSLLIGDALVVVNKIADQGHI
ncbi:hypothetical protein SUGI_0222010 [Cryptomeria japonica]|uniref:probable pectinesterase/pectinesterase inhibitor 61 n=1 Tax=Cryptomeria japonica TaxID=3369 RepID=UPI002408CB4C|nr:probable pectinesterase/pectinesterase inhibitor 61 [Cryptomeria japonica]GLJ13896.1 hypothetical protein SUGI_0222010 [Cryptomeria japonica]